MKTSKKITIAALSAATALVGATGAVSSFAWFATNGTVSATGMAIKSKVTNNYLEIKNGNADANNDENWLTTVAATGSLKEVAPVHPVKSFSVDDQKVVNYDGGEELTWIAANSKDASVAAKDGKYFAATVGNDGGDFAFVETFNIRIRPGTSVLTATNLALSSVAWTDSTQIKDNAAKIAPAMRVLAYNETAKVGTIFSYTTGSWAREETTAEYLNASFTSEQVQNIKVYVYIDGEDQACTSNNARVGLATGYSVNLTFTIAK